MQEMFNGRAATAREIENEIECRTDDLQIVTIAGPGGLPLRRYEEE
jgi:hypothetical protein